MNTLIVVLVLRLLAGGHPIHLERFATEAECKNRRLQLLHELYRLEPAPPPTLTLRCEVDS